MEIIALTTAMADARSAIQATVHEIRSVERQTTDDDLHPSILATLARCNELLATVQVHLWYLVKPDSFLQVPGTNATSNRTPSTITYIRSTC
jgi:hypothetical protein